MIPEQAIAFVLFSIVAAITPGPSNLILTSTGAAVGVRRGLACLGGVASGMGLMLFLVAFGLGSLVFGNRLVLQAIKLLGSCFLLWLAWKIATDGRTQEAGSKQFVGFWQAAVFQWVNPKSWLVSVSAIGTFLRSDGGSALVQSLDFGLLFMAAALPSCFVWLAFGAALQRLLYTERLVRIFNVVMGALLAGSVVLIVR
jgi:threonine/homoserine/homoserine lactone efflux protein